MCPFHNATALSAVALYVAAGLFAFQGDDNGIGPTKAIKEVDVVKMNSSSTARQRANAYTAAKEKVTFSDNTSANADLAHHTFFANRDVFTAGGFRNVAGRPLIDDSSADTARQFFADACLATLSHDKKTGLLSAAGYTHLDVSGSRFGISGASRSPLPITTACSGGKCRSQRYLPGADTVHGQAVGQATR